MRQITRKSFRRQCKTCGRKLFKVSQHGNCIQCATEKVALSNLEMKHKEGPTYDKWRKKMERTIFGKPYVDEEIEQEDYGTTG